MSRRISINRRDAMIQMGQIGLASLGLPSLLRAEEASRTLPERAKSCILLYLWGGPPQQDMWDLKPEAAEGIRSHFKPIKTAAPGIEISDQMPLLAQQMDKLTIIRSMTHGSNEHEASVYHTLTGQIDPRMRIPVNHRKRTNFPGPSGIVSRFKTCTAVPASVTLPRPIMHDGVKYSGTHAGFLGAEYDPLELPDKLFAKGRPIYSLGLPDDVDTERLVRRKGLLELVERQDRALQDSDAGRSMDAFRQRAFNLLISPDTKRALDLSAETDRTRDRYGRNHYGEAFLLARRLVEAGVRLVSFNWMFFRPDGNPLNPWDNHGGTAALGGITGFEMLKADYCIPPLDQGLSALLEDMSDRGMLDETLIYITGEFGRTPKINKKQGRDHWGACYSTLLAGGGIRGGQVYGASDRDAAYPADKPTSPEDLLATMYYALGISPETEIFDAVSRPFPVSRGRPLTSLFG